MRMHATALAALAVMATMMSGCADKTPPMLTINTANCVATPDLGSAHPVTVKDAASVAFDDTTPCLQPSGAVARLYTVFLLPESDAPRSIFVKSVPRGQGVVAPHVMVLDQEGKPIREIPHDRFLSRGGSLQAGIRMQTGERYLLVASNPETVGHSSSEIVADIQQTMVATGTGGYFFVNTGKETVRKLTRAHGGTIVVSAELVPMPGTDSPNHHQSMAPLR